MVGLERTVVPLLAEAEFGLVSKSGAVVAGLLPDAFGIHGAFAVIAGLTAVSGGIVAAVMSETLPRHAG